MISIEFLGLCAGLCWRESVEKIYCGGKSDYHSGPFESSHYKHKIRSKIPIQVDYGMVRLVTRLPAQPCAPGHKKWQKQVSRIRVKKCGGTYLSNGEASSV